MDWTKYIAEVNRLIQLGKLRAAGDELARVTLSEIPREHAPAFAQYAWRINEPELGLRALARYVRPDLRTTERPSSAEIAEYAACLVRLGAHAEAAQLLRRCDSVEYPRTLFYQAASLFARWDYAAALPLLRMYLASPGLCEYERLVARVNIAEALVVTRAYVPAGFLLRELLHDASLRQHRFALAKILELAAQNALQSGDLDLADKMLVKGEALLGEGRPYERLFLAKFRIYLALERDPENAGALDELRALKARARREGHWETLRDLERFGAIHGRCQATFRRVYFGTDLPAFREEMKRAWPEADTTTVYRWRLGMPNDPAPERILSFVDGGLDDSASTRLIRSVLRTLASDFFRPVRTATLFSALYPGEFYHYESSPQRVRQAVKRTRKWLDEHFPGLRIAKSAAGFRLRSDCPVVIGVSAEASPKTPADSRLLELKSTFSRKAFSLKQAGDLLSLSPRSVLRLLSEPIEQGEILRQGAGPRTVYQFR